MTGRPPSPPPDSRWNSIRPYTPRLLLHVREITSVSVAFSLSTTLDATYLNPSGNGASAHQDEDDTIESDMMTFRSKPGIADVLRTGLVVKLNGSPWQKVVIHAEESEEEAIVVLYGLFPVRHYEVELSVVAGEETYHVSVVTNNDGMYRFCISMEAKYLLIHSDFEDADETEPDIHGPSVVVPLQTVTPEATPPTSPRSPSRSPSPPRLPTVEERLAQLRQSLSNSITERDSLSAQLRSARKDAQRADAALRLEVEALKRTAEKNAAAEQRTRQKVLALQETIKRLYASAEEADQEARDLEAQLPQVEEEARRIEEEHLRVAEEAERSELDAEEAIRADKKKTSDLDAELTAISNRLEKLNTKKDKFNNDTIPDLEQQLLALAKDIEDAEKDTPPSALFEFDHEAHYPHHYQTPYPPPRAAPISNARPPPIQRPANQPVTLATSGSSSIDSIPFYPTPSGTNNGIFHIRNTSSSIPPPSGRGSISTGPNYPRGNPTKTFGSNQNAMPEASNVVPVLGSIPAPLEQSATISFSAISPTIRPARRSSVSSHQMPPPNGSATSPRQPLKQSTLPTTSQNTGKVDSMGRPTPVRRPSQS